MSSTKSSFRRVIHLYVKRAHLLIFVNLLLLGLSCDSDDPVSVNNNTNGNNTGEVGTVTDIDGNVYLTVKIGNQVWTVEDLRTTRYNDGSAIPLVTDNTVWSTLSTPGYCNYNNTTNADTIKKFGALYNWYAVNTDKLAPKGWHVPSSEDWDILQKYLIDNGFNWDGTTTGNKIAKSMAAKSNWKTSNNPGAIGNGLNSNNRSDFSALPDGSRWGTGDFSGRGDDGHWWSTTGYDANAFSYYLLYSSESLSRHGHGKNSAFSVRLVKGN